MCITEQGKDRHGNNQGNSRKNRCANSILCKCQGGSKNTDSEVTRAFLGEGVLELSLDYLG